MNDMMNATRLRSPRQWLRTLLPLLVGVAACAPAIEREATVNATADALPMWEVTNGDGTVYLLGSIHMLRPETYPLDDAIYAAFDASTVAAFELHLDSLEAAAPLMMTRGVYQDGRTLSDVLPDSLHDELAARLTEVGIPMAAAASMKPWLAALTVSALTMQRAGFEAAQGIDRHFFERAQAAGKRVTAFETIDLQIRVFDAMPEAEQIAFLQATLDDLDGVVAMIDESTALWKRGDAEAIGAMMNESMQDQPNLRRRLLDDRNQAWVPQIEALLSAGDTAMVIVGMGHLTGAGSVIELLRARGHTVTRSRAAAAAR